MPHKAKLERQIKAWLQVKNLGGVAAPPPEASPPGLPDSKLVELKSVPRLQGSLERLEAAAEIGEAIPALASLMSVMNRHDAEKLYNYFAELTVPECYEPSMASDWFRLCHKLSPSVMPRGITGFFHLCQVHNVDSFGYSFQETLAFWLRALRASGSMDASQAEISLDSAEKFPERFGFVCLRIASGGADILGALQRFFQRIKKEKIDKEISSYLLDFTIETGWLLDETDFTQIWNLIKRRGNLIHGRLSGGLVPVSSIRFLAGILRGIEEQIDLQELFASEREHKAMEIFNTSDRKLIHLSMAVHPELTRYIDDQMEMDLVVEVISHGVAGNDHSKVGRSIVSFLGNIPGGVSVGKIIRFLRAVGDEISGDVVQFLARLVEDTLPENRLSPSNTVRFSRIAAGILPVSTSTDRTSLKAYYRSLVEMKHSEARIALIHLDKAAFHSGISLSSILSAGSLLIRAAEPDQARKYLARIKSTARLIEAFSAIDRKKILAGLPPLWVEAMMLFPPEVEETIINFVYKISNITVRSRYLDNVVTRLLEEVQPEDPVFLECLAFGVTGYNSAGDMEKLRETEHRVFQKVLRAGGRIEAVDKVITDLLSIPGFEGNKSRELIDGIRTVCDRFSRIAVWEEGADKLFADFLTSGVSNILRVFVDNPKVLEAVGSGLIGELALNLMPDDGGPDSSSMTNNGAVCKIFFESIVPDCISLFGRDSAKLTPFLYSIADEFTRSIGGMTGDDVFARYLVSRLDQEILEDRVMVLDAWLSQKTPPALHIEEDWSGKRREEWAADRSIFESTRMKLFGAVSALVGSTGADIKEAILDTAGFLAMELHTAKIPGSDSLVLNWNREMMEELISRSEGVPPYSLFSAHRVGAQPSWEVYSYLQKTDGFMEQDVYHGWRQTVLPPLLNCAIEIELVSRNSTDKAREIAEAATEAIEFLGYSDAESFLSTLQQSFLNTSISVDPYEQMEKNFLLPLWKRNSAERLDLLMLGMSRSRQLMDILLERLSQEQTVKDRIDFMRNYSNFFISVEEALLDIESNSVRTGIAEALMDSRVFSGEGLPVRTFRPVEILAEAAEFVKDVFKRIRYGTGIVTASEAGEISADMRRKYRDNADSVAIILRWTVDPDREGLLKMLEESQTLLQAAGSDTELMKLLDLHGAQPGFETEAQPFIENPAELKKYLKSRKIQ